MTPEQLLQPRVKCIADDTSRDFEVGEIFYADNNGEYWIYGNNGRWKLNPDNYPHLFRKLEWWEDRKPEDMPEYVKENEVNEVWRVEEYGAAVTCYVLLKKNFHDPEIPFGDHNLYDLLPATETEYLTYKNSLK